MARKPLYSVEPLEKEEILRIIKLMNGVIRTCHARKLSFRNRFGKDFVPGPNKRDVNLDLPARVRVTLGKLKSALDSGPVDERESELDSALDREQEQGIQQDLEVQQEDAVTEINSNS